MLRGTLIFALPIAIAVSGCSFDGNGTKSGIDASTDAARADASEIPLDTFRRSITISPTELSAPVANFPFAIQLGPDSDFADAVSPAGNDLLVVDSAGTQLPLEIESIDKASGTLVAWVLLPELPVTGASVFLYYGNGVPSEPRINPWTGLADLVWHFDSVANRTVADSSPSGFDGTALANEGILVAADGVFGSATEVNDASLQVDNTTILNREETSFTLSLWFQQRTARDIGDLVFYKGGPYGGNPGYQISAGTGEWRASLRDTGGGTRERDLSFGDELVLGTPARWHHLVMVVDRDNNQFLAYLNGVLVDSDNLDGINSINNTVDEARTGGVDRKLHAYVDEVRTMPAPMSADWIRLAHANGADESFISIGDHEEAAYPTASTELAPN